MLHYILQTIAFQLFFLIIYDVFLKKETFFNWNRFYLLITAMASVVLPFIKLESIRTIVPEQYVIRLPEVIIGDVQNIAAGSQMNVVSEVANESNFIWSWDYLLYAGMILASLLLVYKIIKLSLLIQKNPKRWKDNLIIVNLLKSSAAFSFFNYVFLGEWIKEEDKESILKHELVHVSQKHSLDLLLFEALRILFWFNPLIYMYQNRITTLHEYIADAQAMKQSNKKQYYEKLLSQVFGTEQISFTNTFFNQSLIKKRILMLSKSKSNQVYLLKYALLIPMVFGMLVYTSSYSEVKVKEDISVIHQQLNLKQLVDKYYIELRQINKKENGLNDAYKDFMPQSERYILTIDELARSIAFMNYFSDEMILKTSNEGYISDQVIKGYTEMVDKYETYEDYLKLKQTDASKNQWLSRTVFGSKKMLVNDVSNLTNEEKKLRDKKIYLIKNDEFYNTLVLNDGRMTSEIIIDNPSEKNSTPLSNTNSDIEVPFSVIDEVPTTDDCKNLASNEVKRNCFSNYISDFVNRNFNTGLAKELNLNGQQRISVLFKIGKDGNINEVKARAPHPALEAEAIRVIKSLPQMIPGRQKGKAVIVPYSLPILFQVQADADNFKEIKESDINFKTVEVAPMAKVCQKQDSEKERRSCTIDIISSFVNENFNTKIAKENGLSGMQRIIGLFTIDEKGNITEVDAISKNEELKFEAIRVLKTLPQMIPGRHTEKQVAVFYVLPILIQIND